jgi:signal transduction histidine kinase
MVAANFLKVIDGVRLKSLVTAGSWAALDQALRRSIHARSEGKLEIQNLDGRRKRTVHVSLIPVSLEKSEPLIGIVATEATRLEETSKALRDSKESLHTLSMRLLRVQDEERRHLARDLHDTIGQELAVAVMNVERIAKHATPTDAELHKSLIECSDWLRKIESETRTLSYVLHPPLLDQIGLVPALSWYIEGFTKRTGLRVDLEVASEIPRLPVEQETTLFRIAQESLTNVMRHSGSPEARVLVALEGNHVRLSIADKGGGFKDNPTGKKSKADFGVGIPGMRGRLRLIRGTLDIRSSKKGATVTATVPIRGAEKAVDDSYPRNLKSPATQDATKPETAVSVARVLVADDHEIARRGIRDLFRDEPDLAICGEACDGIEALAKVQELHPDLLILDLSMPKMGGLSVANHLRNAKHPVKILIYSNHKHDGIERMARTSGCMGCIHKANAARDLVRGARAILRGGTFYEGDAAEQPSA